MNISKMRKREKEVIDIDEIEKIFDHAVVCRLAMAIDNQPYIVPMNFGYDEKTLYFHTSKKGMKVNILKKNPKVSFEVEGRTKLIPADTECGWTMKFESVIGFGKASFIKDFESKKKALNIIMNKYSSRTEFYYEDICVEDVLTIKVEIEKMTGKKSGYK